jgi:hypothetical protein
MPIFPLGLKFGCAARNLIEDPRHGLPDLPQQQIVSAARRINDMTCRSSRVVEKWEAFFAPRSDSRTLVGRPIA